MKTSYSIANKILARIQGKGRGYVFAGNDFLDLGNLLAIQQVMSRLTRAEKIRRIGTALYHYPRVNEKLGGELPPAPDMVAMAIARKTDSHIIPSGALAVNVLGLSTQVPAKMIYLTNGPSRDITVKPYTLRFRHVSPRRMAAKGKISAIAFEALRYLKEQNITDEVIDKLRFGLSADAKIQLKRDLAHAAGWMRPYIQRILSEVQS